MVSCVPALAQAKVYADLGVLLCVEFHRAMKKFIPEIGTPNHKVKSAYQCSWSSSHLGLLADGRTQTLVGEFHFMIFCLAGGCFD